MAIIRLERKYWDGSGMVYEGIVEEVDDLDAISAGTATYHGSRVDDAAEGSCMLCLETEAPHVMKTDKSWKQLGEEDGT